MGHDIFTGGTTPGALTNEYEIKILICYLLNHIDTPLSSEQMNEVFQDCAVVNYFEFASNLAELLSTGHIVKCAAQHDSKAEAYAIAPLGVTTATTLQRSLPRSVRDKVVKKAQALLAAEKLKRENTVHIRKVQDGYLVSCIVSDIGSNLMNLELFAPDEAMAQKIKARFSEHPQRIYANIIALFTEES